MLASQIDRLLTQRHGDMLSFWTGGGPMPEASVEAHCDIVYTLCLTGRLSEISPGAPERFAAWLRTLSLPGWLPEADKAPILVHNCAYAFGGLNLLADNPASLYQIVLDGRVENLSAIVDPETSRPVFPPKWAHHNGRVSHWIGGIPSMILSLSRSGHAGAERYASLLAPVRDATDGLIEKRTGLFRAYKSDLVQALFRRLYAIRHDPELGDVGGIAHILWVDHAIGRPYVALEALLVQSQKLFRQHRPFMEQVPYCLDFDIVQIVRTGLDQTGADRSADAIRARQMMSDIEAFFAAEVPQTYSLHKIPGALATYHECALIAGTDVQSQTRAPAIDIIQRAYWL